MNFRMLVFEVCQHIILNAQLLTVWDFAVPSLSSTLLSEHCDIIEYECFEYIILTPVLVTAFYKI